MGFVTEILDPGGYFDAFSGKDAAKASEQASIRSAAAQQEALEYLKEKEAIPRQYQEKALGGIADLIGANRGVDLSNIRQSPIYEAIAGTAPAAQEAVMGQAAATGGLRSGNVQSALAKSTADIERQALLDAINYETGRADTGFSQKLTGLQALAGQPTLAPQIAQATSGIGQTLAQGQIGAAQAQQQGASNIAGLAATVASFFSDIRLKDNIKPMGQKYGHNWYSWDWNEEAKALGLTGSDEGVMAHEVNETNPELISHDKGYLKVNMEAIKNG